MNKENWHLELGQALAVLKAKRGVEAAREVLSLSPSQENYINELSQAFKRLHTKATISALFADIPLHMCRVNQSLIRDNVELVLAIFLCEIPGKDCPRLLKHLNSCFHCEEEFAEVLREYHKQLQLLSD